MESTPVMQQIIGIFSSPASQALGLASIAAYLTYYYVGEISLWSIKDIAFVLAVAGVVFFHRYRVKSYIEHDPKQRLLEVTIPAYPLDKIEYIQGKEARLGESKVIAVLFFATWCKGSRVALNEFQKVHDQYGQDVHFLALTQETKEDLLAYETHGKKASNFKSLNEFSFAIGIEDGTMTKEYQLKHKIQTIPHVYIIGRDDTIFWQGHPVGYFEDATRRTLSYDFSSNQHRDKRNKFH